MNKASTVSVRVLHLGVGNLYGGIESMLTTLARSGHLCPELHQEFALCFPGQLRDNLVAASVPVHDLGPVRFSRPWQIWRARQRLRRVLKEIRPDVVVAHGCWVYALSAPTARRCQMPVILFAHSPPSTENWPDRLARRIRPDACIANSAFTARAVREWFPAVPCFTVHCPVPPATVPDSPAERQKVRAELQTPLDAVVILFAARMEPGKGPDVLVQALALLKNRKNWVCWLAGSFGIAGGQEYLSDLRNMAADLGIAERLRWLGLRTDVPRLLLGADVLCQPNRVPESFGIVFVEALSAGLPVVSSALGGALEIVDDSCGRLVSPENAPALADTLRELIKNAPLRRRLGANGPARAEALCDPQRQIQRLHDAVKESVVNSLSGTVR